MHKSLLLHQYAGLDLQIIKEVWRTGVVDLPLQEEEVPTSMTTVLCSQLVMSMAVICVLEMTTGREDHLHHPEAIIETGRTTVQHVAENIMMVDDVVDQTLRMATETMGDIATGALAPELDKPSRMRIFKSLGVIRAMYLTYKLFFWMN